MLKSEYDQNKPYLNLAEFTDATQRYPAILYPAVSLREQLRAAVLGDQFWTPHDQYRNEICRGKYHSARSIIESCGRPEQVILNGVITVHRSDNEEGEPDVASP